MQLVMILARTAPFTVTQAMETTLQDQLRAEVETSSLRKQQRCFIPRNTSDAGGIIRAARAQRDSLQPRYR